MPGKRKKVTFVKSEPAGPDGFRKVTKVKKMSEKRAKKKEAKGQGKMFKNYSTDVVRAIVSASDSSLNMGYGKGPHMESAKQEKYNLMHDNPVAKHASGGSWMSKHSKSALHMGHSPLEKHKEGHTEPTTLQKIRNFVEPGLSKNQSGNSRQQMFDYDGDGDTVFNDSNRDGTMLSRGLKKVGKAIYNDIFAGGSEEKRKTRADRGGE